MNRKFIFGILFLLMISNVLALGITPGRTTMGYEPGNVKNVDFSVINSEGRDIDLVVFARGEFEEMVSFSEVSFSMKAGEESKSLSYEFTMPSELEPGLHETEIVVMKLPEKSESGEHFVGATVGVVTQIHVHVPYPGKYAEAELNIVGPEENGELLFVIPVTSRGDLDLVRVAADIDIYGLFNEKVDDLETNEISLYAGQKGELVAKWDADVEPGPYRAVATVIYDEQVINLEKEFNVGTKLLDLEGIEVNDFTLGEIAKFEMFVESKWSEDIVGAYAQTKVFNKEGAVMADFKSATYDIPAMEKIMMVSFWDTEGVKEGTYDTSVFLRYGEQSSQEDLKLEISDDEIRVIGVGYVISNTSKPKGRDSGLVIILSVAVGVLILINIIWFLILRKKLAGKGRKK